VRNPRADLFAIVEDELLQALARVMVRIQQIRRAEYVPAYELVLAVVEGLDESAMVALLSLENLPSDLASRMEGDRILRHAAQMLELPWESELGSRRMPPPPPLPPPC